VASAELKLRQIIDEFEEAQTKYSDWGACDTEPDHFFEALMRKAVEGKDFPVVKPEHWQLFSSTRGWKSKANVLRRKAKKAFDAMQKAPHKVVLDVAKYHGWDH